MASLIVTLRRLGYRGLACETAGGLTTSFPRRHCTRTTSWPSRRRSRRPTTPGCSAPRRHDPVRDGPERGPRHAQDHDGEEAIPCLGPKPHPQALTTPRGSRSRTELVDATRRYGTDRDKRRKVSHMMKAELRALVELSPRAAPSRCIAPGGHESLFAQQDKSSSLEPATELEGPTPSAAALRRRRGQGGDGSCARMHEVVA
jgi:hypothetical protein